ncbi:hypothetical protein [Streptomyces sp. NBC_00083]|uniref:hypothetical protein n=1 Tax=Streptomyces sp. NBC_00083 TaxID=2975647 RepID=UPI002251DF8A|nr:hypothetical protein [Streptomyces sp. NBC_00083]MCX5384798.1 hypothetical protein [Streptomyces sp. NBC_00083]
MQFRTFLAATVLAATTLLGAVGTASAHSTPDDPTPPSTSSSHGDTGLGLNLLCGLGLLLGQGSCHN